MKQGSENGFSLIELMVAMAILLVVMGAAVGALIQTQHVTEAVALQANVQENLRAGMHFLVQDLIQAGGQIPSGGISIPSTAAGASNMPRPGTAPATIFQYGPGPTTYTALSAIMPGWQLGAKSTSINPVTSATIANGGLTDIVNILYADTALVDSSGNTNALNSAPINQLAPAVPVCAGTIVTAPTVDTVTLDGNCFKMPGGPTPIAVGNLMLFVNANGNALEYVTSVVGQTISFNAGDPAGLNATGQPNGTLAALKSPPLNVAFPPTSITRIWMVTYYIDTTDPRRPQLVRQVNYPNFPVAAPANPPQPVADIIEDLGFSYDIISSAAPVGSYPLGAGDAATPWPGSDTPLQIRAVNVSLAGRSEYPYTGARTQSYFRNNLSTQVSIRNMSFNNQFGTSTTAP
jgi:prepilin-type N-terminal cleavage/methylation domain-containing protein